MTTTRGDPATEKQIGFLNSLVRELAAFRSVAETDFTAERKGAFIAAGESKAKTLTKTEASTAITTVKGKLDTAKAANPGLTKKLNPYPEVPAGRYAVDGDDGVLRFYRVDVPTEGKWTGFTFVRQYASDNAFPVKGEPKGTVLRKIAADPKEAMLRYGREIRKCGRCGKKLTNDESRKFGVGPDCRELLGW